MRTTGIGARWPRGGAAALVALAAVAVVAAACTRPPPTAPTGGSCTEASVGSCALPYPSDEFVVPDPGSPTGVRLAVPEDLVPTSVLAQLGPGAGFEDAFGDADGFSALSPVIFELDAPVRPESLPPDGGDVLVVTDVDTGERQEVRAEVWADATLRGAPGTVVMAWPALRWEYGHTYVARVAGLQGALPLGPGTPKAITERRGHLAGVLEDLGRVDRIDPRRLQSATRFTVGSRTDAIGGLERMAATTAAEDHPVRNLQTMPPLWFEHGAAIVTGEVRITDFRDDRGVVDPDREPSVGWVPFVLALPREPASPAGAPVVVYGHGLLINKESMTIVASSNARRGLATIGIDIPNHGGRQAGQGGYLLDLTTPGRLGRLVGMPQQGIVDHVSLVSAVLHHLADLDRSPWSPFGAHGDGRPDLDPSLLLYQGTSMGGVLGAAEFALIPELDAAFLQVPGAGILDILSHSLLWPLFSSVIPWSASAGDAAALLGAASMLIDGGDATHLLDGLRGSGRPVVAQVGIADGIVPEFSSDRLVRMLDLPRVGPARTAIAARSGAPALPGDGRGFLEVWANRASSATLGFMGHITFSEPEAERFLDDWLVQRLRASGIGPG